jgi:hypothetical protein
MKYFLQRNNKSLYVEDLLISVCIKNGHAITEKPDQADAILLSIEDITLISKIKKTKQNHPDKVLIVGGHLAKIAAKAMSIYSDIVWVGHCYEFFECKTIEEIKAHKSSYCGYGDVFMSTKIDWNINPVVKVNKNTYYYWGAVGCKNKCAFCVTSWTEQNEKLDAINSRCVKIKKKLKEGSALKVISNEYEKTVQGRVQSMMMLDFLKMKRKGRNEFIRIGVEFPTAELRRKYGKPFPDDCLSASIKKAELDKYELQFFLIAGLCGREDWARFVEQIPPSSVMSPRIFLKFTNFEPQPKTPLFKKSQPINPENYINSEFTTKMYYDIAEKNKRLRMNKIKYPAHAIWRCMMTCVFDEQEYERVHALKNEKNIDVVYNEYLKMEPWKKDFTWLHTGYNEIK